VHFMEPDGDTTFSLLFESLRYITPAALIISGLSLFILIFWDMVLSKKGKIFQIIQGPLVVVVLGIVLNLVFLGLSPEMALRASQLVELPVADSVGGFFQQFTTPDFSRVLTYEVLFLAGTLAIVASLETLLCLEATDKLDPAKRISPANRELKAQGIGNIVSGLIGGLPVTQVIVRSSANIQSGGRTKLSALIHGILILVSVITIPGIMNMIPLASLAAILIVVGYKLAKPALFMSMFRSGWHQFLPFVVTVLAIVFTDLLTGIGIGMAVGIFFILKNSYQVSHTMLKETTPAGKNKYRMVLAEEVTFLNKGNIMQTLRKIPADTELEIDLSRSAVVDPDVLELIENYKETARSNNVKLSIKRTRENQELEYEGVKF
jgi:MFS superfamily sulfate permease-like transporter